MDGKRIAAVTAGLVLAGALTGGVLVGGLGLALCLAEGGIDGMESNCAYVPITAAFGAQVGAVLVPLAAWMLMRRVPLWLAVVGPMLGTLAGVGAAALVGGYGLLLPFLGFFLSAGALRVLSARRERARISASGE